MIKIGSRLIGDGQPTYVVAEMAWSHDGSVDKAKVIVDGAADAGADAINLHLTDLPSYMVPFYGAGPGRVSGSQEQLEVYKYLDNINLSFDDIEGLIAYAQGKGLAVSTMCNDMESAIFATEKVNPDILMLHPSCVGDEMLLRKVASKGKPLVLYVGGLLLGEAEQAVLWAKEEGNDQVILQHGFQSYPTAIEDNNLRYIETLKRLFGLPVAFGDHTDGGDPMAVIVPIMGVAMGANVIEKHITPDRDAKGEDYESALGPKEFKMFVDQLRQAEQTMGSPNWRPLSERERNYRSVVRKRAVAKENITAGSILTRENITFKRCDIGFMPEEISGLFGNVAAGEDLAENTPIVWERLK